MNVLLADDDYRIRMILELWLSRLGLHIYTASNGSQAMALLKEHQPDILITDVNMPIMNGIQLTETVLQQPNRPNLIILLTSRCDVDEIKNSFHSPLVHVFNKPFSPSALTELIQQHIQPAEEPS